MAAKDKLMGIFRSGDSWRAEVFFKGKRVASKSGFDRKTDAKTWHDETLAMRKGGLVAKTKHTFEDLLKRFGDWHLSQVRFGTKTRYLVDIDQRIQPFFRFMKLGDISSEMLEAFKADISKSLKPKSVNNCLHVLRLILNKGVKWRMLRDNPYALESAKVSKKPYPWWESKDDIARFLEVAEATSRYYPVYFTAIETGMRYGELVGLCKADIDFQAGAIHVHRQWLEKEQDYGPVKHNEPRWIDFDPSSQLAKVLWQAAVTSRDPEILFTTATGRHPVKSGLAEKYFKGLQRKAKVPKICFHGLRHTFSSWYMIEHDNIWNLKAILGHSDVKTTQRYAHHSRKQKRKPLDMASVLVTHRSLTAQDSNVITIENCTSKEWRERRDLNSKPPRIASPVISTIFPMKTATSL